MGQRQPVMPGQRHRGAHHLEEAAARGGRQHLVGAAAGNSRSTNSAELGSVGEFVEAAPVGLARLPGSLAASIDGMC